MVTISQRSCSFCQDRKDCFRGVGLFHLQMSLELHEDTIAHYPRVIAVRERILHCRAYVPS